ncbi:MAG: hypothetical protein IH984_03970 [Planctomycetes bacterium]|nr:hypothetical protein [Planctomycetota bacterium]
MNKAETGVILFPETVETPFLDANQAGGWSAGSSEDIRNSENKRWQNALDVLLSWQDSEDSEAPTEECWQSAIDLAYDWQIESSPVPSSIAWSGDGGIVFEWSSVDELQTVEVIGSGIIEVTVFRHGKVIDSFELRRDPRTRKLELQG